ncbi:MAG: DUF3047 domain-containing protein [Chitinivibrionales bacterium]|nr:DUF3047 domain-containing protein [Chitinivibrionales bacterium]MBD3358424.1 DUF3047 domain-containing protein [Chitinivibrionales bacterium]
MTYALVRRAVQTSAVCFSITVCFAGTEKCGKMRIESFSDCISKDDVPCGWHPTQNDTEMFSIGEEEGNYYLRVETRGGNTTIGKRFRYNPEKYRYLYWRWRVHELPEGAREDRRRLNDSGAAVYVIFKGSLWMNKIIKYVWSTTLDAGTCTASPFNGRAKVVVVRSGTSRLGEWITEKVDVYGDYTRLFGHKPPMVEAIALMSDADNTRSEARADYDDFRVYERKTCMSNLDCSPWPLCSAGCSESRKEYQ